MLPSGPRRSRLGLLCAIFILAAFLGHHTRSVPAVHAAGEKIQPRKAQDLFVDPSPVPPIEILGAGAVVWQKRPSPSPSPSVIGLSSVPSPRPEAQTPAGATDGLPPSSGDETVDEIQRDHARQAQRMQLVQAAMGGGDGPSLQQYLTAEGKQRLFHKVIHHPRFVPFAFVEVCWFLAMVLLPIWVSSVIAWKWIARIINFMLLDLYLAGALIGLPLGIFGKELEPLLRTLKHLSGLFA